MPRFIRIQEDIGGVPVKHASFATRDEIVSEIDVRSNPIGGYTNVEACISMLESPENWREDRERKYMPFPCRNLLGVLTFHVEGVMDFAGHGLEWKEPGHRCDLNCAREWVRKKATPPGQRAA